MLFRQRLNVLSAKVKKAAVGVLTVAVVAGSVVAGTSIRAGAYSKTQDILNGLLGTAKPYGVVAEEFKNANHNQTCFATNKLVITDQWMSAWLDMSVGTTYIRSFDNSGSSEVNVDRNAFNNLVLGTDYDYEPRENKYYIKDADGKRTGAVINVTNCKDTINVYYAEDYMDVTAALDNVYDNFKVYADTPDSEADIVISAYDERKIDLSSFKNKQIVVVNMYANNYIDWQEKEVSSYYGEGQLNITNKAQGQFVIINLLGGDGDAEIKRFSVNGKNTGGLTDIDISDTVIFNAVNVTGHINIGEVCGIVVAPKADITLTSTCNGRAISKSFVNVNGQMHFISDNQQQETTQKETTSAAESSLETTKADKTTAAQETTQADETTAAQETTKLNKTTIDAGKETKPTKPNETTVDFNKQTKEHTTSSAQVIKKTGEVAGDEELVTEKENETVDGSRVRKTGEVAADEEVIKTGDNNHVWVYIVILVAAAVISGTVIVISKKNDKR